MQIDHPISDETRQAIKIIGRLPEFMTLDEVESIIAQGQHPAQARDLYLDQFYDLETTARRGLYSLTSCFVPNNALSSQNLKNSPHIHRLHVLGCSWNCQCRVGLAQQQLNQVSIFSF